MQLRERVGHHARRLHVVDGDRIAVVRLGVQRRVVPARHRDLGQLLDGRAVLVHVTARRHRVLRDQRMAVRHLELHGTTRAEREVGGAPAARLQVGAGRRAVHEDDDLDVTSLDGRGGVLDHELPRAATDTGAVDPRRLEPAVLGDLDRREQPGAARTEAVDVGFREARVGDRAARGLVVQLERRLGVDPSAIRECRADDRDARRAVRQRSFQSSRLPLSKTFWPSWIDV